MRWQNKRSSDNIEDRRSQSGSSIGGRIPIQGKSGFVLLVIILVAGYYGVDLTGLLNGSLNDTEQSTYASTPTEEQEAAKFTSVILASTEDYWQQQFNLIGKQYIEPKLVLYKGSTTTACGMGQAIMGPFYCSVDKTVYLDLSFYQEMKRQLGGGGDFAQGYVIAHEIGHHVQNLLGTFAYIDKLGQGQSQRIKNQLSVQLELQADCYAGLWGHQMSKENILEVGDLETALNTAEAIGDDRLQQQGSGKIVPDSFTHGTSAQRYQWFKQGFDSGKMTQCELLPQ
ncbi:hypothetical protein DES39_1362 [Orbus hercynius]|uniref:Neutral zinc metallopeptidase n=1 Tax=Orbus hercynius TaxID=593135 RepID=A0A495RFA7_9GAMM|nr:neutral zinc metallopeptidase [Orbus hercynius]RKS85944.1 hypothetical protein DES39_1362 [Orbus hercynius]